MKIMILGQSAKAVHIDPETAKIIGMLSRNTDIYIVGGFVRDIMMNTRPGDIDLVVKDFDKAVEALKKAGFKVSEEARCFRVVKVYTGNGYIDVAGFRQETYDYRTRKPVVAPAKTIYEDLARRDFTINAMALEVLGIRDNTVRTRLIDPYNGLADIRRRIIRAVGNPRVRFLEDPLRIMRMIRFAAKLRFRIDNNTFKAAVELRGELKRISWERIRDELLKSLRYNPALTIKLLHRIELYRYIFGGDINDKKLPVLLTRLSRPAVNDATTALSIIFYTMGYTPRKIETTLRRLKMSSTMIKTIRQTTAMIPHMINAVRNKNLYEVARILVELKEDKNTVNTLVKATEAITSTYNKWLEKTINTLLNTPRKITGYDAVRAGIPSWMRSEWLKKQRINEMILHYKGTHMHNSHNKITDNKNRLVLI